MKIVARTQNCALLNQDESLLKCSEAKSAAQFYTQLRGTQQSGDLSGVLAMCL